MTEIIIPDDFYPGISVHRNLRQSPESITNRYRGLLRSNGIDGNAANLSVLLSASRQLYGYLGGESEVLEEYKSVLRRDGTPVRGPLIIQFELVYNLLAAIVEYSRSHPFETLGAASSLVIIEDFLEGKLGRAGVILWQKLREQRDTTPPRREVLKLVEMSSTVETTRVRTTTTTTITKRIVRKKRLPRTR